MAKYAEGTVSPSGKFVVQGGQWVPVQQQAPAAQAQVESAPAAPVEAPQVPPPPALEGAAGPPPMWQRALPYVIKGLEYASLPFAPLTYAVDKAVRQPLKKIPALAAEMDIPIESLAPEAFGGKVSGETWKAPAIADTIAGAVDWGLMGPYGKALGKGAKYGGKFIRNEVMDMRGRELKSAVDWLKRPASPSTVTKFGSEQSPLLGRQGIVERPPVVAPPKPTTEVGAAPMQTEPLQRIDAAQAQATMEQEFAALQQLDQAGIGLEGAAEAAPKVPGVPGWMNSLDTPITERMSPWSAPKQAPPVPTPSGPAQLPGAPQQLALPAPGPMRPRTAGPLSAGEAEQFVEQEMMRRQGLPHIMYGGGRGPVGPSDTVRRSSVPSALVGKRTPGAAGEISEAERQAFMDAEHMRRRGPIVPKYGRGMGSLGKPRTPGEDLNKPQLWSQDDVLGVIRLLQTIGKLGK